MAAINDLISQIQDETLRNRIQEEVSKMAKQKKFGLVFEEHMPESTPLYDMPIKRGCNVMRRDSKDDKSIYVVLRVEGDTAVCVKPEQKDEAVTFDLKDIVRVAEFGESIYPYLKPLDSVCNAPDSDLWHTLIEADNYHALQLLEYLYAGKVDCIYIDPPYNTGAKDWKYNNDYVDGSDAYRHSKWLSFMQRRLKLAKKLLNPKDSVLIVTIDEKEYLHLGCLLEEMFPEARLQMITSMTNKKGSTRQGAFCRRDEYLYILFFGEMTISKSNDDMISSEIKNSSAKAIWNSLLRRGADGSSRKENPNLFYPFYISTSDNSIVSVGEALPLETERNTVAPLEGTVVGWPIRSDGSEGRWQVSAQNAREMIANGTMKAGRFNPSRGSIAINYLMVTNNEVSADEAKMLKDKGCQPGDAEWEKLGIAHYVTWPRTVCSIEGHDVNGNPLKGDYLGSEPLMHMADGFKANAAFFKLGFLDPTAVSLGMRFSEMLPTLWLKTGAKGKYPELTGEQVPDMLILPENQFAVLINENTFADFAEKLAEHPEIQTVFLATDYEVNYQSMVKNLNVTEAYQLYRDYLDHFRVNRRRN